MIPVQYSSTTRVQYPGIEVIQFWIPPGRCITWEMGGSQFTMTLWMGYGQTPEIENGNAPPFPRLYTCLGIQNCITSTVQYSMLYCTVFYVCTS